MDDIRQHLKNGKTVKEIVELGFKKPSVYKCRKELKDKPDEEVHNTVKNEEDDSFHKENEEVHKETLENDNNTGLDTSGSTNSDNVLDNQGETKEDEETLIEELFGDDDKSFRDFNEVDINRNYVDIPVSGLSKQETKIENAGNEKLGVSELLTQVYSIVGVMTGNDNWELSSKEQKIVKHLCKIPSLEKFLHKFGLYGCVITLITLTFKKIKNQIEFSKTKENYVENDETKPIIRPDSPGTVMELFE